MADDKNTRGVRPNNGTAPSGGRQTRSIGGGSPLVTTGPTLPTKEEKEAEYQAFKNVDSIKNIFDSNLSDLRCTGKDVEGAIVVRLKSSGEGVGSSRRIAHIRSVISSCAKYKDDGKKYPGIEAWIRSIYSGYIGVFPSSIITEIKQDQAVARVSVFMNSAQIENYIPSRSWLNARISLTDEEFAKNPKSASKDFSLDGSDAALWQYDLNQVSKNAGKGVTIYIVDMDGFFDGDFGKNPNRVIYKSSINDYRKDLNGPQEREPMYSHGTTVANIAGGDTYGCATQATIWVYAPKEAGSCWSMLAAFDKIAELRLGATTYGVMNCSWDCPPWRDSALSDALQAVMKTKVIVVASAGNDGKYMADRSYPRWPSTEENVIVAGMTDMQNRRSEWSNYGPLVDIYAPGTDVYPKYDKKKGLGTSYAAPLVAGFIAGQLSDLKPDEVADYDAPRIKELLWQKFSRITDTYSIRGSTDGKVYPIRCLTAFMQPSQGKKGEKDLPCSPVSQPVGPYNPQGEGMLKVVTTADTGKMLVHVPMGVDSKIVPLTFQQWTTLQDALKAWPTNEQPAITFFRKEMKVPSESWAYKGESAQDQARRETKETRDVIMGIRNVRVEFEGICTLRGPNMTPKEPNTTGTLKEPGLNTRVLKLFKWLNPS